MAAVVITKDGSVHGPFESRFEAGFFATNRLGVEKADVIITDLREPTIVTVGQILASLLQQADDQRVVGAHLRDARVLIAMDDDSHRYVESFEMPNENNGLVLPTIYPGVIFDPRDL